MRVFIGMDAHSGTVSLEDGSEVLGHLVDEEEEFTREEIEKILWVFKNVRVFQNGKYHIADVERHIVIAAHMDELEWTDPEFAGV